MKHSFIILVMLFSCELFAQEDRDEDLQQQYDEVTRLYNEVQELVTERNEFLYNLKLKWFNTCVEYLKEGNLRAEEIDQLIDETRPEIDGEGLYNELIRAKNCLADDESYTYQLVASPIKDSLDLNQDSKGNKRGRLLSKDPAQKAEKKEPEVKKPDKKDSRPPVEEPKNPATPVVDPPIEPVAPPKNKSDVPVKKSPQKVDKGEMEEGMRKKRKNNDGTN